MKKALSVAVATLSIASLVGGTAVVSAHGDNNRSNWGHSQWHGDKRTADVRFIDGLVIHHQTAVDLANVELQKGTQAELKAFAQTVVDTQTQEITDLKTLRDQLTKDDSKTYVQKDSQYMKSHDNDWGLPDAGDVADSSNVDLAFIDAMTSHHAMMLPFANKFLTKSDNDQLKQMVRKMVDTQSTEIGQLSAWRQAWFPDAIEPPFGDNKDY